MKERMGDDVLYIGCPMWGYREWVGSFFPPRTTAGDFLRLYSRRLNCVEGNTTFYATPSGETIARWRAETPASFRICPKISRAISHEGDLANQRAATLTFIERLRGLGERLGPIFLQLPPAFSPTDLPQLQSFLDFWPAEQALAVEVRHAQFFEAEASERLDTLLREYQAARVLLDTRPIRVGPAAEQRELQKRERKPDLPLQVTVTSSLAFVRYIGHPRMPENEPFLTEWARQFATWLEQGLALYVFCHCPYEVHSPAICAELYRRVQALTPLPDLPWDASDSATAEASNSNTQPTQQRLF